jgi:hypothetical protein
MEVKDQVRIILYSHPYEFGVPEPIGGYPYEVFKLSLNELPHVTEWFHLKANDKVSCSIFIDVNFKWIKEPPKH